MTRVEAGSECCRYETALRAAPSPPAARVEHTLWPKQEKRAMNLRVDRKADAPYLRLDDSAIVESEEVSPGVVLDYNESNEVVGVEMFHLSKRSTNLDLSALHFETA